MDKNLPDNIDKFFLDNLQDFGEEPINDIWTEIDKRLPEQQQKEKSFAWKMLGLSTAAVLIGLLLPFILNDVFLHPKKYNEKYVGNKTDHLIVKPDKSVSNHDHLTTGGFKNFFSRKFENNIDGIRSLDNVSNIFHKHFFKNADSIAIVSNLFFPDISRLNQFDPSTNKLRESVVNDDIASFNQNPSNTTSNVISLSINKQKVEVIPFFSVDHISGRFIEQYEFDHEDKNDYNNREKPDMSFTGGLLVAYKINKKLALTSGVSVSKSAVAISSTAVNALKDANGVYKFKLATSYGFAEISKTGVTPTAGDSLFVSNGMMQLNYISFPVLLNYNFGSKKMNWSVHAGIALNKVMSDKVQVEYTINNNDDNETVNKIEGVKRIFFTLNTGVEAKYSITRSIALGLSPELRYGINSINKGTPVKTYPINYGLAANIHINL
ncbi:MAG: outer membrane beta-barrel protein [Parafilimonas sp.]|nr:outer membrane beta-barrel protein [Parafilimonas sp.]